MKKVDKSEQKIDNHFSQEAKSWAEEYEKDGFPKTVGFHAEGILKPGIKSCIDVGSGPGMVLIDFVKKGLQTGYGVDLSEGMCAEAKRRIKEKQLEDRIEIFNKSFLDFESNKDIDAISFHKVLCCHPEIEEMLQKSIQLSPEIIAITIPRSVFGIKNVVNCLFWIRGTVFKKFRPYIHKQKLVTEILKEGKYQLSSTRSKFPWLTTIYTRETSTE